ncbi:MAG: ATP-binding protein [Prolixibacteraceae bacterium]|nr:ATP-binding protein [Prolixibacteraceae bacterium]
MDQTKDMVLSRILIVLFFFMALGLTISLLRVPETGFKFIYGVQMCLAVIMVLLYVFQNKLKSNVKGAIFLSVIYTMALMSVFSFGIYGFGWAYFIPAVALGFLYYNKRIGTILAIVSFFILASAAFLFSKGILSFKPENSNYMENFSNWLNMIITTLLISIVIVMFWNNLYSLVSNTFQHIYNQQEDMKKMNQELVIARDRAQQSDKMKSSFLQNISHEIRTPLNIIIGFSDMVSQTDDPKEHLEFNKVIRDNSNTMLKIVNDIVDFSKIETNSLTINKTAFNVNDVLSQIEIKYQKNATDTIQFALQKLDLEITTDKDRFYQIINNLLENAFKFTSEGKIEVKSELTDNHLKFKIIDTGIGIPETEQKKIFERFYRIDAFSGGAGLGLSLAHSIANCMEGNITVVSKPNIGSTFEFQIPISK